MAIKKKTAKKKVPKKAPKTAKKTAKKKVPKKAPKKSSRAKIKTKKSSLLDRIASHREELEKAKNKAEKSGEKLFKQAVKEIRSGFPELKSFSWNQYTPHWNDGDTCQFGCHISSLKIALKDGTENEDDVWTLEYLSGLLSGDIEAKKSDIEREISKTKQDWERNNLKSKLEEFKRTPEEIEKIHEMYSMKKTIVDLLEGIDESVYEKMFGEGTINVTRDDITVSECEHD